MNIIWIEENLGMIADHAAFLILRGHKVDAIEWYRGIKEIKRVLQKARPDVVIVHAGSVIPRSEAAHVVGFAKSLGAKVIVDSVSRVLFENADDFILKPFGPNELADKIICVAGNKTGK